ncbi:MAG: hypothetical protein H7A41_07360 [Chlamydiales bacterium]|nr:hypothetical protein [Chlamydiales bacterium]
MKRICIFAMIIATIGSASVFGNPLEREYVDLEQVLFDPSGMYVEVNDSYQEVDALIFDKTEGRYYVLKKEAKWKCGNCGKYNDPKDNNCWYCGWPWGPPRA